MAPLSMEFSNITNVNGTNCTDMINFYSNKQS